MRELDDRAIGNGKPGPVTQAMQQAYFALVRGEDAHASRVVVVRLTPVFVSRRSQGFSKPPDADGAELDAARGPARCGARASSEATCRRSKLRPA